MEENQYKDMNFIERLQYFMEKRGINDNQMTVNAGLSVGLIGKAKVSGKGMSSMNIEKILLAYPELSADWLLTGKGDMKRGVVDEKNTPDDIALSYDPAVGIPYYDVDFIGGFDTIFNDQTTTPQQNIVFDQYSRADLWCNITGHSMAPKINHGDIIALKKCSLQDIQYGEIYAIVMDTIRTVKILRKSSNPEKLRFVPVNLQEYDEQEFDISRILQVYEVLGCISKFF